MEAATKWLLLGYPPLAPDLRKPEHSLDDRDGGLVTVAGGVLEGDGGTVQELVGEGAGEALHRLALLVGEVRQPGEGPGGLLFADAKKPQWSCAFLQCQLKRFNAAMEWNL